MKRTLLLLMAAVGLVLILPRITSPQMRGGGRSAQPQKPLPPGMRAPMVRFEDLAAKAGLTGVVVSGSDKQQAYIVENTGTGLAILDYDNDGLPDIFFVNGDRFERTGQPQTHYLYHNLGGLRFEDVTRKSGILHKDWGQGVCAGDFDNDGYIDLFVTSWGKNVLWRNHGDGTFRDETQERGLS